MKPVTTYLTLPILGMTTLLLCINTASAVTITTDITFTWTIVNGNITGTYTMLNTKAKNDRYVGIGFNCSTMQVCKEIIICYRTVTDFACKQYHPTGQTAPDLGAFQSITTDTTIFQDGVQLSWQWTRALQTNVLGDYTIQQNIQTTMWAWGTMLGTALQYHGATLNTNKGFGTVDFTPQAGAACGNGARETGEGCDDGNTVNGDGCTSACAIEVATHTCVQTSVPPFSTINPQDKCTPICGNGIINTPEVCDDGDTTSGDGCSSTCTGETGWSCSTTNSPPFTVPFPESTCTNTCGDGTKQANEACDDGNTANFDGCSSTCTLEATHSCVSGATTPATTCTVLCGNGLKTTPETCDDGNLVDGDGCSHLCVVEQGFACVTSNAEPHTSSNPFSTCARSNLPNGWNIFVFITGIEMWWEISNGKINAVYNLKNAFAQDNRYMGVGFNCQRMAKCKEIIACYKTGSNYGCKQYYPKGQYRPLLAGTQYVNLFGASYGQDSSLNWNWTRNLDTGVPADETLTPSTQPVIWAYGDATNTFFSQHTQRGVTTVVLGSQTNGTSGGQPNSYGTINKSLTVIFMLWLINLILY